MKRFYTFATAIIIALVASFQIASAQVGSGYDIGGSGGYHTHSTVLLDGSYVQWGGSGYGLTLSYDYRAPKYLKTPKNSASQNSGDGAKHLNPARRFGYGLWLSYDSQGSSSAGTTIDSFWSDIHISYALFKAHRATFGVLLGALTGQLSADTTSLSAYYGELAFIGSVPLGEDSNGISRWYLSFLLGYALGTHSTLSVSNVGSADLGAPSDSLEYSFLLSYRASRSVSINMSSWNLYSSTTLNTYDIGIGYHY